MTALTEHAPHGAPEVPASTAGSTACPCARGDSSLLTTHPGGIASSGAFQRATEQWFEMVECKRPPNTWFERIGCAVLGIVTGIGIVAMFAVAWGV